jgi:hypothetical protein
MTSENFPRELQAHAESFAKALATNKGGWMETEDAEQLAFFETPISEYSSPKS